MRLIGYHGTRNTFDRFDLERAGSSGLAARGHGVHFHSDIRLAEPFAGDAGRVIEAEITLTRPAIRSEADTPGQEATPAEARAYSDALKAAGHDGLVVEHEFSGREIVVFDPACIRITNPAMTHTQRAAARRGLAPRSKTPDPPPVDHQARAFLSLCARLTPAQRAQFHRLLVRFNNGSRKAARALEMAADGQIRFDQALKIAGG